MFFLVNFGNFSGHSVHLGIKTLPPPTLPFPQKHHPSLSCQAPPLNLQTVQAYPLFISVFHEPPHPPPPAESGVGGGGWVHTMQPAASLKTRLWHMYVF